MNSWWWKRKRSDPAEAPEPRIRSKYTSFRELLSLNNECLELLASIQEDLQYAPPTREALGDRIAAIFEKTDCAVATLERLTGKDFRTLREAVRTQRQEVESHVGACQELISPNLSAWLSELDITSAPQVGSKAATLGEIRNKLHLPVPDGYVLTAEAYLQFCGRPLWKNIRDATRNVDLNDLDALQQISRKLTDMVMALPVPRPLEVAIAERAHTLSLRGAGPGLAVRSSAVGEGDARTFAGQFLSLLNVYPDQMIDGYKRVVAGRFSERALFYRLSAGLPEVESPIAVLCLRIIRARASGIIYSRDPSNPKSEGLWVTATRGLGLDIASGASPADLFVVERRHSHRVLEQNIVRKEEEIVPREGGGLERYTLAPEDNQRSQPRSEGSGAARGVGRADRGTLWSAAGRGVGARQYRKSLDRAVAAAGAGRVSVCADQDASEARSFAGGRPQRVSRAGLGECLSRYGAQRARRHA